MEVTGRYYNTKQQVEALEKLLGALPDPAATVAPSTNRPTINRVRKLDPDQIQALITGYQNGETIYQLGDRFNISRKTASAILHRNNIPTRRRNFSPEQLEQALHLHQRGWTITRISQHLQVGPTTVRRALRNRGNQTRNTRKPAKS